MFLYTRRLFFTLYKILYNKNGFEMEASMYKNIYKYGLKMVQPFLTQDTFDHLKFLVQSRWEVCPQTFHIIFYEIKFCFLFYAESSLLESSSSSSWSWFPASLSRWLMTSARSESSSSMSSSSSSPRSSGLRPG